MPGFISFARGSFMLDFVVVAMAGVLPVLTYSIYLVKVRKNYQLHKRIQVCLAIVLGLAVTGFEIDMRVNGWQHLAQPSPYFDSLVFPMLNIHLLCAISTLFSWIYTIFSALRRFPTPVRPNAHSPSHRRWARFSTVGMFLTATTGWIFYWLSFVAT